MQKLGGLDAMFLYAETDATPMHVGVLTYLEISEDQREGWFDQFRSMLSNRLHLVPYMTSRLKRSPWNLDHPVWVRHRDFDIDQHLHRVPLEAPGSVKQIERTAAELYESRLDRSRPLWEMWVIEGLADGRLALLQKTHHACLDGASSVKAAELLFDFTQQPREVEEAPEDFWEQAPPARSDLWRSSISNVSNLFVENTARAGRAFRASLEVTSNLAQGRFVAPPTTAPKTRLNGSIDHRRRFTNVPMSLSVLKRIAKAEGAKINDVVLLICGEGLKQYLGRYNETPRRSLIANCPVSRHAPDDKSIKNQVTAMNVDMATGISDLRERLAAIHESANGSKGTVAAFGEAMPTDFALFGMPSLIQTASWVNQYGLAMDLAPAAISNVVISNVPGFPVPLYIAGARLESQMPMSIVVHGAAVNFTVASYCDRMDLGITAATRRVPDVDNLRDDLLHAYDALASELG